MVTQCHGEGRFHVSHREVARRCEPRIESEEVREAIVERTAAGPVHVTLIKLSTLGAGSLRVPRAARGQASAAHVERGVVRLRDAGVAVKGIVQLIH